MAKYFPQVSNIINAHNNILNIMNYTKLLYNCDLSTSYNSTIFLKREDLTPVRSYKIRGAYNKLHHISKELYKYNNIYCVSAGNHAQGVAYSCNLLNIKCNIYMPIITPLQKINNVKKYNSHYTKLNLIGNDFDETFTIANNIEKNSHIIHPFNDPKIIEGQATVGLEILRQQENIDYVILPIGGGGLASGVSAYIKQINPKIKIIGVQSLGADSMNVSINQNKIIEFLTINKFVDGASVKKVGNLTFDICKETLDNIVLVNNNHIASKIIEMYNNHAMIIEPAGALSLCALDILKPQIKKKKVVCIISGGNNDMNRAKDMISMAESWDNNSNNNKINNKLL